MATAPSPNDLTRQQLDELDALLQRMLALPLDQPPLAGGSEPPAEPPEPAPSNWRVDPPAPAPVSAPRLFTPPLPAEPPRPRPPEPESFQPPIFRAPPTPDDPLPRPARSAPERTPTVVPAAPPPEPAEPVVERKVAPAPVVERTPLPAPAPVPLPIPVPTPAPQPVPAARSNPHPPSDSPVPFVLWPLVAVNWAADALLGRFGPPGRLLRSGFGKNLLGVIGLGLLVYTAAHVASEQGWVRLPFPIPWPR